MFSLTLRVVHKDSPSLYYKLLMEKYYSGRQDHPGNQVYYQRQNMDDSKDQFAQHFPAIVPNHKNPHRDAWPPKLKPPALQTMKQGAY